MARALMNRLLACLLAITSGFAVPATAVAHGYEHHGELVAGADHRDAHDHDGHHSLAQERAPVDHALTASGGPEIHELPLQKAAGHPHPCLDRARSSRIECPAFALVSPPIAVTIEYERETVPSPEIGNGSRPRALTHAPPPPSRAPPTKLG